MGDQPSNPGAVYMSNNNQDDSRLSTSKPSPQPSPGARHGGGGTAPFHSQYSAIPAHQHQMNSSQYAHQPGANHHAQAFNQVQPGAGFDMNAMAGALPTYGVHTTAHPQTQYQQQDQRRLSGASTPAVVYQLQQNLQYPQSGAAFTNASSYPGYGPVQYAAYAPAQISPNVPYSPYGPAQPRQAPGAPQLAQFSQQSSPQYYYYPAGFGPTNSAPLPNQTGQLQYGYMDRSNSASSFGPPGAQDVDGRLSLSAPHSGGNDKLARIDTSNSSLGAVPRGPPRKPKQSGHALWVGNLPPGATVLDLKDHFSRDATREIESLFLISKSNCGFVNYRTEDACAAAMQRFHDSRFQGVRLVCRLRRASTPSPAIATGPSATAATVHTVARTTVTTTRGSSVASSSRSPIVEGSGETEEGEPQVEESRSEEPASLVKIPERFFIVKSLTLQDLEQSVRNGIWATQAHNEQSLNQAFETAENVYLIFSANKSGEYFGYAKMISPIGADSHGLEPSSQHTSVIETVDAPRKIPTPATEFAPKGHIIDDSARGTIFWEADLFDIEDEEEEKSPSKTDPGEEGVDDKPFRVEWISTNRIPFYRTRGLRNPWNANREVKIARDGTELETSVGKRLIQMFHRPGPASGTSGISSSNSGLYPMDMGGPLGSQMGYQ